MKQRLINSGFIKLCMFLSIAYYSLVMVLTNKSLFFDSLISESSFITKLQLLFFILFPWGNINFDLGLLLLVSGLTGANLSILIIEFKTLSRKKAGVFSAGSTFIGVTSAGCVMVCSAIPFFFVATLTGSSLFLTVFENLKFISPLLLSFSFYLMMRNYKKACLIKTKH